MRLAGLDRGPLRRAPASLCGWAWDPRSGGRNSRRRISVRVLGKLDEAGERVRELHLARRAAVNAEELGARDDDREAPSSMAGRAKAPLTLGHVRPTRDEAVGRARVVGVPSALVQPERLMGAIGTYVNAGEVQRGPVTLWAEWEPQSRVVESYPQGLQDGPRWLHEPWWEVQGHIAPGRSRRRRRATALRHARRAKCVSGHLGAPLPLRGVENARGVDLAIELGE